MSFKISMNVAWITRDVNTFAITPQEALTAIAEQDSNLKLIKWAVKVTTSTYEVSTACDVIIGMLFSYTFLSITFNLR